ncbi:MAG: 3-phosphoglycerate dehydrogenase [Ruminiclostridium sp.]|nr:3-phosphoglycerate dehydrogenase [Ruminiclostridium sp.]
MYTVQTLNKISEKGLDMLQEDIYKISSETVSPDAILVRSANMLEMQLPDSLMAIARAGAGVNNIPVDKCTEQGIVVFNTPGANANGVKELVIASLFLSSRKIYHGIAWAQSLKGKGQEVGKLVEKGKSAFEGPEILGKRIGIIGLGAIGAMVANDTVALGMEVIGYDPYISVNSAWGLSRSVIRANSMDQIFSTCDYITIHIPLDSNTKGIINKDKFKLMKKGTRIINLARGGLVDNKDLLEAIGDGTVACYVTDFPEDELLGNDSIVSIPHLGASTLESEDNCAVMAVKQMKDYLEYGIIRNSVNFPECDLTANGNTRLIAAHLNIPNMVGQITTVLAESKINITAMVNRHKNGIGYDIIDIDGDIGDDVVKKIRAVEGVKMARIIK